MHVTGWDYNEVKINIRSSTYAHIQCCHFLSMLVFLLNHTKREGLQSMFRNSSTWASLVNYSKMSMLEKGQIYQKEGSSRISTTWLCFVCWFEIKFTAKEKRPCTVQAVLCCKACAVLVEYTKVIINENWNKCVACTLYCFLCLQPQNISAYAQRVGNGQDFCTRSYQKSYNWYNYYSYY